MRPVDADALKNRVNERYRCCNSGSIVEACLGAVLDIIDTEPTIAPSPNPPLTLEELREMDGEPVWVVSRDGQNESCWMLVDAEYELCREAHGGMTVFENNGKTWLAYRRKPEEVTV